VVAKLDKNPKLEEPDLILVQGDTTTALAGALAGLTERYRSATLRLVYAPAT